MVMCIFTVANDLRLVPILPEMPVSSTVYNWIVTSFP